MPIVDSARALMLTELARYIAAIERPHPVRVAIDGRTAAGKTTLADELVAPIEREGRIPIRIQIDDFYRPLAVRRQRQDIPSWQRYYLDSFDHPAIRASLLPLGPEGDRQYRHAIFDSYHDVPIIEPTQEASPNAIILIDGVFLYRPELDDLWDVRIFVDIDSEDSLQRGPPRDQAWVGSVEAAAQRYHTTYIPGEEHYIATIRPHERADIIIDNRNPATPHLRFRAPSIAREGEA